MNLNAKLTELQKMQQQLFREYEAVVAEYQGDQSVVENESLRREKAEWQKESAKIDAQFRLLREENDRLRLALQEQMIDEKLNILKISRKKLATYFEDQTSEYCDKLTGLEEKMKSRLLRLKASANERLIPAEHDFSVRFAQLELELHLKLREQEDQFREAQQKLKEDLTDGMDNLAAEPVTPEMMAKRARQNQWEMRVGLNWINKIGILLILLGVGAACNYTYRTWMSPELKGICFFLLGSLFLIGGEWCYRKAKTVFSTGLLGGGTAILYGATFYSYFGLHIIGFNLALMLAVLVTLTTVALAVRYNSATIGSLGLIGGYLPFLSMIYFFGGFRGQNIISAMGYLLILNLSLLLISYWKKWNVVSFISFLCNIPSMVYLVFQISEPVIAVTYTTVTFLMYLGVTLIYSLKHQSAVKIPDVVLLGMNTLVNSIVVYSLFEKAGWIHYQGLTACLFCLVYTGLGRLIQKRLQNELRTMVLFYATALTFAVLIIPFQFGVHWLSLGWLIEGVILAVYGCRTAIRSLEKAGWGIFFLCLISFGLTDFLPHILELGDAAWFDLKYLAVTLGAIILMIFYVKQMTQNKFSPFSGKGKAVAAFKYYTVISTWIYLMMTAHSQYGRWMPQIANYQFYDTLILACITIGIGYLINNSKLLFDRVIKGLAAFLYILGDLVCIGMTFFMPVYQPQNSNHPGASVIAISVLILYNLFAFANIRMLLLRRLRSENASLEHYPLWLGLYLLGVITAFLIVQFSLGDLNLLFSFVYLAAAIGYIVYGFMRRFVYIRRLGLGLTLFATAKLFIYDLSFLNSIGKIIAYFGFGLVLLAISFVYQKVKNSLEERLHVANQ